MLRVLILQGVLLVATATAVMAVEVEKLPGYSKLTVSEEFVEYLNGNKSVASALEKDTELSRLVMTRAVLQKQLMTKEISLAEIEKSYFPHRRAKADDAKTQDNMFITDAADITQRAITNTRRTANTQRAQKDIEETLDKVAAASSYTADETAAAPQPSADNNLSAIPSGDAVDANGWPVAMNVPADCPARVEGTDYIFNRKLRRASRHNGNKGELDRIHGFFYLGNGQVVLNDGQEQAAPFVTANTEGQQPVIHTGSGESAYSGVLSKVKVAYSYCPGDFSNTTPEGEVALSAACAETADRYTLVTYADNPERATQSHVCHLEPNKRYFANIRFEHVVGEFSSCAEAAKRVDSWSRYLTQVNGKEVGICAALFIGGVHSAANNGVPAPYSGNCLNGNEGLIGKGLYPLNYTDLLCHGAEINGNDSGTCVNSTALDYHYTCYDPTGKNQPREYVNQCVGNKRLWTKGHMLETPSEYLCEVRNVNSNTGAVSYGQGTDGPAAYAVCAAHNEGRVRQRTCTRSDGVGYADGGSQEQCQFIAARGRYDWVEISTQGDRQHVNSQGDLCKYTFVENVQLPSGCSAGGKIHAVGTKKTITCNKGRHNETTHVSECRVQGEGFAPAFVAVSGSLAVSSYSRCDPAVYE